MYSVGRHQYSGLGMAPAPWDLSTVSKLVFCLLLSCVYLRGNINADVMCVNRGPPPRSILNLPPSMHIEGNLPPWPEITSVLTFLRVISEDFLQPVSQVQVSIEIQ